jgi:hypothetical protein
MTWQIDLVGDEFDIGVLKEVSPLCECTIEMGLDGRQVLGGAKFDDFSDSEEVRAEAESVLMLLNGFARLRYGNHRPVQLGSAVSRLQTGGRRDVAVAIVVGVEARGRVGSLVVRTDGTTEAVVSIDKDMERAKRIVADPKLIEIAEAVAGDISWQRLRVAFEKVNVLVGKGDNALVRHGYATQHELNQFKANVEDPRHSGLDAVHGVPQGRLKGVPMTAREGLEFVIRLFTTYLDRASPTKNS